MSENGLNNIADAIISAFTDSGIMKASESQPENIVEAVVWFTEMLSERLKQLGNGDAYTGGVGAIEGHGMAIERAAKALAESLDSISDSIDNLADAIKGK